MSYQSKNSAAVEAAFFKGYRVVSGVVISPHGKPRAVVTGVSRKGRPVYESFNVGVGGGNRRKVLVHRLAAYQKFGAAALAPGVVVHHLDGNSLNNHEDNIEIGSATDNALDRDPEDRKLHAAKGNQRYSEEFIQQLREEHASGLGYKKLRAKYGMSLSMLSYYLSPSAKRTSFNHKLPKPHEETT